MDLGNPVITALVGLIIFYIGLKTFSGGMKSMGNMEHLSWFLGSPFYMFFGGIIMTLLWQSSSLSTTAIIALVASGALPLPAAIGAVLGANIGTTACWTISIRWYAKGWHTTNSNGTHWYELINGNNVVTICRTYC